MARPRRFERPTPFLGGRYSIQLSYGRTNVALYNILMFDIFFEEFHDISVNFFSSIFV